MIQRQSGDSNGAYPNIGISIVSHGHGLQVAALVQTLADLCAGDLARVVVSVNIPEPDLVLTLQRTQWPFLLNVLQNTKAKGFGANHNAAAAECPDPFFCVLNPDVELHDNPFPGLLAALDEPNAGCAYPIQVSADGVVQVSAREVPTPASLIGRYCRRFRGKEQLPQTVHWATAACLLFKADVYRQLGGFDERYFMYCEDVDICLRLQLLGYRLVASGVRVVHVASAASHRNTRHLAWHVRSLLRLWTSASYRQFLR